MILCMEYQTDQSPISEMTNKLLLFSNRSKPIIKQLGIHIKIAKKLS